MPIAASEPTVALDKDAIKKNHDAEIVEHGTRVEQAELRTEQAETRTEQAKTRTEQAEVRTEQAESRTEEAKTRTEKAEMRTEQAESRSEQVVLASELLYRRLFEAAQDGILILDGETGQVIDANPVMRDLLGYSREQILGRKLSEIVPFLGASASKITFAELQQADSLRHEGLLLETKGGQRVEVEFSSTSYLMGQRRVIQCNIRDITETKKNEESLNLFRSLMDRSPDAIEVVDPKTGRFLDVNDTACQKLGYSREEMLSLSIFDVITSKYGAFSMEENVAEIRKNGFKIMEGGHRRKDGSTFPSEVNVQYIDLNQGYLVAVVRDITDRKRAEAQIAEQASFLDMAQDAILVRDLEGNILFWNKGAERMYGWTGLEVVGRNIAKVLYPDPQKFLEVNGLAISKGEWYGELQHLTKDKQEITIEARWTLIRDNEGLPKSVLAINTDITERKKIEAQFMRAQRMESIGTLAGGIAHDLNNILAPIVMSIDLLKGMSENPQAKDILQTIEVSARRGADIVRQVLSFARGLEGQRIEVQPKHLLNDVESIIKDTFPKDIHLLFSIPDEPWLILGDPTQIHQILLNLCVNARDAMPNGGNLTISVENSVLDEHYAAMNIQAKPGRYVKISVSDTGTGIPRHLLEKIFEPFFTTKDISKGTGLGLSTVIAIVKSHEGIINVYSEVGKGTTFKLYLPAMESSCEARKELAEQNCFPRGNGEMILVVDDEASILNITCQTLQAFGYRVLTATNGAEAVAKYAQHRDEIAVVLTDMAMPVMDGPVTIHALLQINPAIKIIAASGLHASSSLTKESASDVRHFLTKPYTAATLLKTMRAILDAA